MSERFVMRKDVALEAVAQGVSRRILAHSEKIMLVEVHFEADAVGAPHTHPHEQATYVVSGRFRFTNGGETTEVGPGDSLCFAPNVRHGVACLEEGVLIDVFTPCREDFLPRE